MAQVKPYEAPDQPIRPSDRGTEAFAMAGRRVGAFYHQEGEELGGAIKAVGDTADRFIAHSEISHGGLGYAGIFADLTEKWNKIVNDPNVDGNNPTIAARFQKDEVEPAIEKFQNGFISDTGSRWAEGRVQELREHFFIKSAADMTTLAGRANVTNAEKLSNTLASTAYKDWSSVPGQLRLYDKTMDGVIATSNMSAEGVAAVRAEGQRAKEAIVQAGVYGAVSRNPNVDTKALLANPAIQPYIKAIEPEQLQRYQQGQQRIASAYDRSAQADQRRQQEEAANGAANAAVAKHMQISPDGSKINLDAGYFKEIKAIAEMPGASPSMVRGALDLGEHMQKEGGKVEDDPLATYGARNAMLSGDLTLEDLMRLRQQDKIGDATFKNLYGEMNDLRVDPEKMPEVKGALEAARDQIAPMLPIGGAMSKDPDAIARYNSFAQRAMQALKGLTPQERIKATDLTDPNSLWSKIRDTGGYIRPFQERLNEMQKYYGGVVTPPGAPLATPVMIGGLPVPKNLDSLRANKQLESNGTIFRDKATGQTYDRDGNPIKAK
jgi:hypothetical protein